MKNKKHVAVTASTGIARLQFVNGQTLHHWSGYGDGHVDINILIERITTSASYANISNNINNCEALIIDEIGMISSKTLECVELICRSVKGNSLVFGGIQVIAAGSFYQLPPIPSLSDEGLYAFQSGIFCKIFPHHFKLETVLHQTEMDLIKAINELCDGRPTQDTVKLIKPLKRPIQSTEQTVHMFGNNLDVKMFNHDRLDKVPGPPKNYISEDSDDKKIL